MKTSKMTKAQMCVVIENLETSMFAMEGMQQETERRLRVQTEIIETKEGIMLSKDRAIKRLRGELSDLNDVVELAKANNQGYCLSVNKKDSEISALKREAIVRNTEIVALQTKLKGRGEAIEEADTMIFKRDNDLHSLRETAALQVDVIDKMEQEILSRNQTISEMRDEINIKSTCI